ncbi:hypothetical protein JEZ13_05910 [bacterium]|nr:hypothetical protein [bacterium]
MKLYLISTNLELVREKPFKLEREMQKLVEDNLETLFGLEFVKSEFALHNFRLDTLAYDRSNKSFVIIEYKRDKNFSVIDQGYAYLSLLLNNKADFILEYNENKKQVIKRDDIEWSQSRVLFLAPEFTPYQRESINFKDLPIELWEIKKFVNNTLSLNQIKSNKASESIKTISPTENQSNIVDKEIKVYSEKDHLNKGSEEICALYEKLKNMILNLDSLDIKVLKFYIAFVSRTNVVDITIQKKSLKLFINLRKGDLDDPKQIMRDVSQVGHQGNGDYEVSLKDDEDFEYILSLVKQSVKRNS